MNKVNAFCKKEDFYKSKELDDGKLLVRYNETESGVFMEYGEAVVDNTPESVRELITEAIDEYDQSPAVNSFVIDGKSIWLNRETRLVLRQRFVAEKATGATKTSLWYGADVFNLTVDDAIKMLNEIEVYACKCYDVTASHKAAVQQLDTIEDLLGYDYKTGYPEKLEFKTTQE
jgi:hypothetical protein